MGCHRHEAMTDNGTYEISVESSFREWWRYNVFITAACYAPDGTLADYAGVRDCIYEPSDGKLKREKPQNYDPKRISHVSAPRCSRLEIYVYVIANTMPSDDAIKHSPPFEASVSVTQNGKPLLRQNFEVNQWGGSSLRFDIEGTALPIE